MKQTSILFFALVVILASCKTEVDLNAPYKNTTIIFGLLDPDSNGDNIINASDTQWIKINKTFLGEGNNNDYALIRDSSEYKEEDFVRKVVERVQNGVVTAEYILVDTTMSNRSLNGIFYGPEQTVYYFIPRVSSPNLNPHVGLNQNSEYRIVLEFTDGRVVTAMTNVIASAGGSYAADDQSALNFAERNQSVAGGFSYKEVTMYVDKLNASIYDVYLRFHYTEKEYATANWKVDPTVPFTISPPKYLDYYIGGLTEDDPVNNQGKFRISFDGRGFFAFLKNNLPVNPRIQRIIGNYDNQQLRTECFDQRVVMGNSDLRSYIQVNSPSTGIVQERPIYSNVSNGIGLFASKGSRTFWGLPLVSQIGSQINKGTLQALCESEYTLDLNFCDPNLATQGCPCSN